MTKNLDWIDYEALARRVVSDLRNELGVREVEGKQTLSGTSVDTWEIEGKATLDTDGDAFLVVEARRHTTSGLKQEDVAGFAYRIKDLKAAGGILITPRRLQNGAVQLAQAEGIHHIVVPADGSLDNYMAQFLGQVFHRASVKSGLVVRDKAIAHLVSRGPGNTDGGDNKT